MIIAGSLLVKDRPSIEKCQKKYIIMKHRLFTLVLTLTVTLTALAQATQPCIVKQYNQKRAKTPLAGVQVEVRDAASKVSDNAGMLTLQFNTQKAGDRVTLRRITKTGYEIFNKTSIEQWNISRDQKPFEIVLVSSDVFAQLKNNLTQSSTDNYKRKYEQAKDELLKQQKSGKLKEEEYRKKMIELEDQYDNALKNLDNYIDQFARIDLSEVSAEEQRILEMVEQGKIDEAVKAYEELDISNKLRQARANKKALSEAKKKIEAAETKQDEVIAELTEKQKREIATLKLAGGKDNYDKVARMLKENALADTTNITAVWEYAWFVFNQKDFQESEHFWMICLNGYGNDKYKTACIELNLGMLYLNKLDYTKAEEYFLKALENYTQLSVQNPDVTNHLGIARTQNMIGNLNYFIHNYTEAEDYYLKALVIFDQLYTQNPDAYRAEFAGIQGNLGNLYSDLNEFAKSEKYYLKALEMLVQLFNQNPDACRSDMAKLQNNMGNLYASHQIYDKAEDYLLKALENRTLLFTQNPDAYRTDLAFTQFNLGYLYSNLNDDSKSEEYYLKALENINILFSRQPESYRRYQALMQYRLMSVYAEDTVRFQRYDTMLDAALANYEVLYQNNNSNQSIIVELRNRKGWRYLVSGKVDEGLALFESTYKLDPEASAPYLARGCNSKAYEYAKADNYTKALEMIDRAITLQPGDANYYDTKGEILLMKGDTQGAVGMWHKVLELNPQFVQQMGENSNLYKQLKEKGLIE